MAGFVGETNFIDGVLEQGAETDGASSSWVAVAIPLDGQSNAGWSNGQPVKVAVRPESVRLVPPSAGGLEGRVVETIYGGGDLACIVEVAPGLTVTARGVDRGSAPAHGR